MKRLSISLLSILAIVILLACKSAVLGPEYPITDFSEYDCIVIAKVNNAVQAEQGYRPLKTFNITIIKSLKGKLEVGEQINGKAKNEEPHAVCPVFLEENSDYLLLLNKSNGEYLLSRFSLPVKKGHKYFDDYISQIEKALSQTEKK